VTHPRGQVLLSILALSAILLFNSFFYLFQPYDGLVVTQEKPLGEVYEVDPGGPADLAGIQPGDLILAIDGRAIRPQVFEPHYPAGLRSGEVVHYDLLRYTQIFQVSLKWGAISATPHSWV
jgi:C-terminal processing protease CtpA/Prc